MDYLKKGDGGWGKREIWLIVIGGLFFFLLCAIYFTFFLSRSVLYLVMCKVKGVVRSHVA